MTTRHLLVVAIGVVLCCSCTPAFTIRLFNRSGRDVIVTWDNDFKVRIRNGKDKTVASVSEYGPTIVVAVRDKDIGAEFAWTMEQSSLPKDAIRGRGALELCLEYGVDRTIYALDRVTLTRLNPQPDGFPVRPTKIIEPNPVPTADTGQRHAGCPRGRSLDVPAFPSCLCVLRPL